MKKLTEKQYLYYYRMLVTMFRPYHLSRTKWTKRYHYWVEDSGSSLSLWRSDWRDDAGTSLNHYPIERLITIETHPMRRSGQLLEAYGVVL